MAPRIVSGQGTGKSPQPADKNVCATWRRLSSLRVQATFQSPAHPEPHLLLKNSDEMHPGAVGTNGDRAARLCRDSPRATMVARKGQCLVHQPAMDGRMQLLAQHRHKQA